MLKINEIFYSIQGESTYAGLPTIFIRLTGCNLRCTYCDTKYSYFEGEKMTEEELLSEIKSYDCNNICITGGEPLLQKNVFPFIEKLCDLNHQVSVETSGNISTENIDPRAKVILDVKTPDSGAVNSFAKENLNFIQSSTEFKFVICSEKDFLWAVNFLQEHPVQEKNVVLFSPSFKKISEKWLAEKILLKKLKVRLQLQQHKYIWSEHKRGV